MPSQRSAAEGKADHVSQGEMLFCFGRRYDFRKVAAYATPARSSVIDYNGTETKATKSRSTETALSTSEP